MDDEEWAFFSPFLVHEGARSGRPPADHRLILDGVFWIARTGVPWRDLHEHFGKWSSVYRQFRRWTLAGMWDVILEALNELSGFNASWLHFMQSRAGRNERRSFIIRRFFRA